MELIIGLVVAAVAGVFFVKSRQEKSWAAAAPSSEMLYYKQGGTRGMKPTEISIDSEGKVSIEVRGESPKTLTLNKSQREELKVLANTVFSQDLEESYLTGARDLPKTTLRYQAKSVIFHNRNAPEALVSLGRKVREMTIPS